ncbi:relaxase/mobilization nuclease domain-containing protein [Serratia marcescens]
MIIKIHSRGAGSGSGPVDYLLGKDRQRDDARVLRGDAERTRELIDGCNFARAYTSGVLSFQEADIAEPEKARLMDEWEQTLMTGLDKDQYACLWVEHQDKGRLELNFVIPNIELQSGKRLQPYFDRADRPRVNAWQTLTNDRLGLRDPNDPAYRRPLTQASDLPRDKQQAAEKLTAGLMNLMAQGAIRSRQDVVTQLESIGLTVDSGLRRAPDWYPERDNLASGADHQLTPERHRWLQPATGEPESEKRRGGDDLQRRQPEERLSGGAAGESARRGELHLNGRQHGGEVHREITPPERTETPLNDFDQQDTENHDRNGKTASERLRELTGQLRATASGVAGKLQQFAAHVRDYLTGTEPQRQGVSALEQSGEQLARSGRELEQQSQPVNALVKQHEHQLKLEKQRTRYHGPTL